MIKVLLVLAIFLLDGCSQKFFESSNEVVDKKDTILYDFTEEKKIEDLKNKYGVEWRNHI